MAVEIMYDYRQLPRRLDYTYYVQHPDRTLNLTMITRVVSTHRLGAYVAVGAVWNQRNSASVSSSSC